MNELQKIIENGVKIAITGDVDSYERWANKNIIAHTCIKHKELAIMRYTPLTFKKPKTCLEYISATNRGINFVKKKGIL